jgi:thiol:disulfide interchange protein DsbD
MRSLLALACFALLLAPAQAADIWTKPSGADELLPAEAAFRLDAVRRDGARLKVDWTIAPGYYLYRQRLAFEPLDPGAKLGEPELPKGEAKHDEHFGTVEIYRETLSALLRPAERSSLPKRLRLRYQGCADAGVCYPPIVKIVDVAQP